MMKQIIKFGLILMLGSTISACSSTMSWKEEVKLHDGQIAISERYYKLGGYPAIESRERAALNKTVTFSLPGTNKKIIWQTDFRDSQPEPNSLNLIRFDVVKGMPYIATYPAGCIAYNKWGRPNPPQVLFKYEGDQWKRITLAELPAELINAPANVVVGRPATSLLRSYYTVKGVDDENYDIHAPEYKTILREAMKGDECPEWVLFEGSWVTPSYIENNKRYQLLIQKMKLEEQEEKKRASDQEN